jgi:NADH-quinone oxidoreductase subunit C
MSAAELFSLLQVHFGTEKVLGLHQAESLQPQIIITPSALVEVAQLLRDDERFWCDMLTLVTGIDHGVESGKMSTVYHLTSILHGLQIVLRCELDRENPEVPSLANVWRAADWHERETNDLMGIIFTNHPDPRRILLPADWEGHPLRKDYSPAAEYHNIPIPSTEQPNRFVK